MNFRRSSRMYVIGFIGIIALTLTGCAESDTNDGVPYTKMVIGADGKPTKKAFNTKAPVANEDVTQIQVTVDGAYAFMTNPETIAIVETHNNAPRSGGSNPEHGLENMKKVFADGLKFYDTSTEEKTALAVEGISRGTIDGGSKFGGEKVEFKTPTGAVAVTSDTAKVNTQLIETYVNGEIGAEGPEIPDAKDNVLNLQKIDGKWLIIPERP